MSNAGRALSASSSRSASMPGARRWEATRSKCTCITCAANSARMPSGRYVASVTWSPGMSAAERPRSRRCAIACWPWCSRGVRSHGSALRCSHSATRVTRSTSYSTAISPSLPRCSLRRRAKAWASSTSSTHRNSIATRAASPSKSGRGARSCVCTRRTHPTDGSRRKDEGFDDVEIAAQRWRVFSSYDAQHGILVQVGEVRRARDAVALAVARGLAVPLVVALPVLGVLVWIAVTFGLARCGAIGRAVSRRDPADVKPLDDCVATAGGRAAGVGPERIVRARVVPHLPTSVASPPTPRTSCVRRSLRCGRRPRSRSEQATPRSGSARSRA